MLDYGLAARCSSELVTQNFQSTIELVNKIIKTGIWPFEISITEYFTVC